MKFIPSGTSVLYKYELQPWGNHQKLWCMVAIVDWKKEIYTAQAIKKAKVA